MADPASLVLMADIRLRHLTISTLRSGEWVALGSCNQRHKRKGSKIVKRVRPLAREAEAERDQGWEIGFVPEFSSSWSPAFFQRGQGLH